MNGFIERFTKRPVLSISFGIIILLFGSFGLSRLQLRLLPMMPLATIVVTTNYPGAGPGDVQTFLTEPLQKVLVGINGVDVITAKSEQGTSTINVMLNPGVDANVAMTTVLEKIQAAKYLLPTNVQTPSVAVMDSNKQGVMILSVSSKQWSSVKVSDYLERVIVPELQAINGVSQAQVWGDDYAMKIWLNPEKLQSYHLTPRDVLNALNAQNVLSIPGSTEGHVLDYHLDAATTLSTQKQFSDLVIKRVKNYPIRIADIGRAEIGAENDLYSVYYNDKKTTMMMVASLPDANPLTIAAEIQKKLPSLQRSLPADLTLDIAVDLTAFIHDAIHELVKTIFEATLIVIAVIFMFLGTWRAVLIPIVTIPLSLIGMCFLMNLLGYSLNLITFLAMVLAIGLVVDDAIVVVENIVRYLQTGLTPLKAALQGTKELVAPITSMTLTLAAVYAPIGFSSGVTGQLFTEFAFTLAGAVIISGVIALTLSPMMAANLLTSASLHSNLEQWAEHWLDQLKAYYQATLTYLFKRRRWVIGFWLLSFCLCFYIYKTLPSELMPTDDMQYLMIAGQGPVNANRNYTDHYIPAILNIFKKFPAIDHQVAIVESGQITVYPRIPSDNPQHLTAPALAPLLQQELARIPGLEFQVITPTLMRGNSAGVQVVLKSTADFKQLYFWAKQWENAAKKTGKFLFLNDDLQFNQPEASIKIDASAAAAANVSMSAVSDSISLLMSQGEQQQFNHNGRSNDVIIKTEKVYQLNPDDLGHIPITTNSGAIIPLSSIASIRYGVVPQSFNQFQKQNSVTLSAAPAPGVSLSDALTTLTELAYTTLPKGISIDYAGLSRQFLQEGNHMLVIFAFAFMIIFLVLSMQFNSFRAALIILLGSVPMTFTVALLPLKLGLGTMNIYTEIGLLTLVGLISKHGILITQFANLSLAECNGDKRAAVIKAALLRFRPIIMTTLAMVVSSIPLIFASGASSASRHALGIVIGLGMSFGTLCTLLVLPIIYELLA